MDVAPATSTVSRPSSFMTAHGGNTAAKGADPRTPSESSQSSQPAATANTAADTGAEPLVNRFPSIAFSYDVDASRLVMLYRDPANGKTVSQIPTETALKQYKEAQEREKNTAREAALAVTVGGSDAGTESAAGRGTAPSAAAPSAKAGTSATAHTPSIGSAHVAHFTPAATHPAAASTGARRVNVVI